MKEVNVSSCEVENVDSRDYPDFVDAYISYAEFTDNTVLTDEELEEYNDSCPEIAQELAFESMLD